VRVMGVSGGVRIPAAHSLVEMVDLGEHETPLVVRCFHLITRRVVVGTVMCLGGSDQNIAQQLEIGSVTVCYSFPDFFSRSQARRIASANTAPKTTACEG
jgi:hypothetical protein